MKTNTDQKMDEFYLDVQRYTFDFMLDNNIDKIVLRLDDEGDIILMKELMNACFPLNISQETRFVLLRIRDKAITSTYIDERSSLSFKKYLKILYKYAYQEDVIVEKQTKKSLFTKSLDFGFARLVK